MEITEFFEFVEQPFHIKNELIIFKILIQNSLENLISNNCIMPLSSSHLIFKSFNKIAKQVLELYSEYILKLFDNNILYFKLKSFFFTVALEQLCLFKKTIIIM